MMSCHKQVHSAGFCWCYSGQLPPHPVGRWIGVVGGTGSSVLSCLPIKHAKTELVSATETTEGRTAQVLRCLQREPHSGIQKFNWEAETPELSFRTKTWVVRQQLPSISISDPSPRGSGCHPADQAEITETPSLTEGSGSDIFHILCRKTNPAKDACSVAQSCPTLSNSMDCSLPGSSVHGIFQARILEWVAISFSRGSSQPRDQTWVSCIATGDAPLKTGRWNIKFLWLA